MYHLCQNFASFTEIQQMKVQINTSHLCIQKWPMGQTQTPFGEFQSRLSKTIGSQLNLSLPCILIKGHAGTVRCLLSGLLIQPMGFL